MLAIGIDPRIKLTLPRNIHVSMPVFCPFLDPIDSIQSDDESGAVGMLKSESQRTLSKTKISLSTYDWTGDGAIVQTHQTLSTKYE